MRHLLASCLAAVALAGPAAAKSHLWKFTEVFSSADGSVQFVEMFVFDPAGTAEIQLRGFTLESEENVFVFPNNLPNENTFQRWMLIATPGFAALPGAPTPDFVIPAGFFDPAGDELRYRTMLDVLPLPPGAVPVDGIQAYLRNGTTAVNTPTNFAGVEGSVDSSAPCDDGFDNDGDGYADHPDDPACRDPGWPRENAKCQDGLDNDGQTGTDFDAGVSILGAGGADPSGADPQCLGAPWRDTERPSGCGLGFEIGGALAGLALLRRRRPAAARPPCAAAAR
jgi:hypothetical protein